MCGDGANDCGALKAANTGISLSEAESSVASPFTSKNSNITCVLDIIKEGRAALVTSFGIFKFMASYSLCQFVSVMILYSIDSNLTDFEYLFVDLCIISITAFFFGKTASYSGKLVKETPLSSLISVSPVVSLLMHLVLIVAFQATAFQHLQTQEWFIPFDASQKEQKDSVSCVENYTIFTISCFQYIILAIVFSKGKPYRQNMYSNYGLIFSSLGLILFSTYMALYPCSYLVDLFKLIVPDDFTFRLYLLVYALVNFICSILVEVVIIDYIFFKKLRFKYHNVDKSKRKYLATERDLQLDSKWPVLSSDYKSAASPQCPTSHCTAEIVIEKENFSKNHILNLFYDNNAKSPVEEPKSLSEDSSSLQFNDASPIENSNSSETQNNDSGSELYHSLNSSVHATPEKTICNGISKFHFEDANVKNKLNNVGIEMNNFENR